MAFLLYLSMRTEKIGSHTVTFFEDIHEIPEIKREKFETYAILGSELNPRIDTFNEKFEKIRSFITNDMKAEAEGALINLKQSLLLSTGQHNFNRIALGALIYEVDQEKITDNSDEYLNDLVLKKLCVELTTDDLEKRIREAKKNFQGSLK